MDATEIVGRIVDDPIRARRLLKPTAAAVSGISDAFLSQVLRLFATDHARLIQLKGAARLVLRYGDNEALGHRAIAIIHRAQGKWIDSANSFLLAGETALNERDRLSFKTGAIDSFARAGRLDRAIELGRTLVEGLSTLGEHALADRAALNLGYALMEQDRYEEAWKVLGGDSGSIAGRLRNAGYEMEAASARLALSTSLLFGGEVGQAKVEAQRAVEDAGNAGFDLLADIARGNVAYANLLQGDADLAVSELLKLRARDEGAPVEKARTLEYLGDAYTAMNLWVEAAEAYREALALGSTASALHRAHLRHGLGQALLASGQYREAEAELRSAGLRYRKLGNHAWQAASETDRALALGYLGRASLPMALSAVRLARTAGARYHLARALVVAAESSGSVEYLEEAETLAKNGQFARLIWRIEAARARGATVGKRLVHYRRMLKAILADQARASSFAGRLGFLRDKEGALREYLAALLSKPSPTHLREALEVVSRTRSVTLLDELLHARQEDLSEDSLTKLTVLRQSLNQGESEIPAQGTRRSERSGSKLDQLQRGWFEETYSRVTTAAPSVSVASDTAVVVQSPSEIHVLCPRGTGTKMARLGLSPAEVDRRLRWLAYELLAPMTDRECSGNRALKQLRELGEWVVTPLIENEIRGVCPEGVLFRIPWLACLDATGRDQDLEIRIHPGFMGKDPDLSSRQAMLWVASHQNLPQAEGEASDFLRQFPAAMVCHSANEVRQALTEARASVLHVISHARHQNSHPMFSSLDFEDGPILAAEIARSGLAVDLVTLSGCDTGRLSDVNRFEPDGLVRSFLACGAGFVVGSAWPLDDVAARHLYKAFYEALLRGANVHQSLREARVCVRRWKDHPYFWASPLLYGGYRK